MGIKSPIHIKILNDTLDIVTLMTHGWLCTTVHSALNNMLNNPDYNIPTATVFSNERKIYEDGKVTNMPVYLVMFIKADNPQVDDTEYLFWCYFWGLFFKKSSVPSCITNIIYIFANAFRPMWQKFQKPKYAK